MYTDNVGRKRWWLVYGLGFAALALAHAWPFLKSGTYFIWGADGYSQMYPVFCYFVSYVRQMLAGLAHGRLSLPLYDFTLGLGGDILSTLNWHGFGNPFYLLGLLAPLLLLFLLRLGCLLALCSLLGGLILALLGGLLGSRSGPMAAAAALGTGRKGLALGGLALVCLALGGLRLRRFLLFHDGFLVSLGLGGGGLRPQPGGHPAHGAP